MSTVEKKIEVNTRPWSMQNDWNASSFIGYLRDTKKVYEYKGWPNGHRIRNGEYYNAVVVFGDTDLNRSRERARAAAAHGALYYLLVGTLREQTAIGEELSKSGIDSDRIVATHASKDTEGNTERIKEFGLIDPKLKVLAVTHEPHAKRLEKNFLGDSIEYLKIPETSLRRVLEHKIISFFDNRVRSGVVANIREDLKSKIEKE